MDRLEDDGPVVLARRKSRHGSYYEEIPPEPEPTPVPVVPEHVPEPVDVMSDTFAIDYDKWLKQSQSPGWTAISPVTMTQPIYWHSTGAEASKSYSISLNDVIGAYKGGHLTPATIQGIYDPPLDAVLKKCSHQNTEKTKEQFKFNKSKPGGTAYTSMRCQDCGKEFHRTSKF